MAAKRTRQLVFLAVLSLLCATVATVGAGGKARGEGGLGRPLKISKAQGAGRQVEEAIKALERGNFDIAVTLAGAAEGMLERSGRYMWSYMLQSPQAAAFEKKELVTFLNEQRD
jgi:hypothetical protein